MLLRVSSNQQLEADGDLSVQRQLVEEYVKKQPDWELDPKEYFEGSNSGYKNSVANRSILKEALRDAEQKEYDILVAYKDDRIGRRIWDIGAYVMELKSCGVDIYTVKDGCITPENTMEEIMLALRYGNAQKSSADTGMRVKDTAQKLVQQGKFMGGKAPYGYQLKLSGEISKHGRVLHHLVVVPEQAKAVKYIYQLSLQKEFGSAKIARTLNENDAYKDLAPHDVWKSGTITSILTNPVYAGYMAYMRRERVGGKYHRLGSADWITSSEANQTIAIIDSNTWNLVQHKRRQRNLKYQKKPECQTPTIIKRNDGSLPLVDIIHCGYCGCKLVNGSRYSYWQIKSTGEKKRSQIPIYRCQNAWQGVPHVKTKQFRADDIEPIIFDILAEYIGTLQAPENILKQLIHIRMTDQAKKQKELVQAKMKLAQKQAELAAIEENIPKAMAGHYPLSLQELITMKRQQEEKRNEQAQEIRQKEAQLQKLEAASGDFKALQADIPTWQDVFLFADTATKRVLINQLIERIDVKTDQILIRFRMKRVPAFSLPKIYDDSGVPKPRVQF